MVNLRFVLITLNASSGWKLPVNWPDWITYCHGQLELGSQGEYEHWQIYAEAKVSNSLTQWKTVFGRTAHIEARRGTQEQAIAYVSKSDTRIHGPDTDFTVGQPTLPIEAVRQLKDLNNAYKRALTAPSYKEALDWLKEQVPRDYVLYHVQITRTLQLEFAKDQQTNIYGNWTHDPCTTESLQTTAVILTGPSGYGKTRYALSKFQSPLLCSHIDDLKKLNPNHDGIVFDDMNFQHYPPNACIHLVDMELTRSINVKYGIVSLPAFTKRIFTTNRPLFELFSEKCSDEEWNAINRRVTLLEINEKLF